MPGERTVVAPASVEIAQYDVTVQVSVSFLSLEAADAFFDQISSEHLDSGVITIISARG